MKKFTLMTLLLGAALSANAQTETTLYSDDFSDLIPYTSTTSGDKTVYDGIGTNDCSPDCLNLTQVKDGDKTAYDLMTEKGYEFLRKNPTGQAEPKTPQTAFYLQKTVEGDKTTGAYLRIGVTMGACGLVLPPLKNLPDDGVSNVTVSFQWCPVRQGSGTYDFTHLSVTTTPYDSENEKYGSEITKEHAGRENVALTNYGKTEDLSFPKNSELAWHDATLNFGDYVFKNGDKITIRPGANQWPMNGNYDGLHPDYNKENGSKLDPTKGTCRFFLRNIKVTAVSDTQTSVVEALVDDNAPVEYYNLQGMRVAEPENGLYIVKQGNKVSKKIIRK